MVLILLLPLTPLPADTRTAVPAMPEPHIQAAIALMNDFAERTGLVAGQSPRRYLWTDAFAVCNYLGLAQVTGEARYTELARQLVDQVHDTLGRHRDDDERQGWISGLDERDGEQHPTRGGLRIGKSLPERGPAEPLDERLEWDRDGQYFHYLTKWMHALDQVARASHEPRYNTWARELARSAFTGFTSQATSTRGTRHMAWKMSIDLTRPLVPSTGQHDPLDGYITTLQVHSTAARLAEQPAGPDLADAVEAYAAMIRRGEWATPDPLGLGGLLVDAWRLRQLTEEGTRPRSSLFERLLDGAATGLHYYARSGELHQPARYRLAFRELGLAIGLHALEYLQQRVQRGKTPARASPETGALLQELGQYLPMRDAIENFWRNPANQQSDNWIEHRDINEVMLATSLVPEGFLILLPLGNEALAD